jgi:hypothetical protein
MADCFDTYVLRAPLPAALATEARIGGPRGAGGLLVGAQWGAENAWVAELRSVGVAVYSPPCGTLRALHRHCSQLRPHIVGRVNLNSPTLSSRERDRAGSADAVCTYGMCSRSCVAQRFPWHEEDAVTDMCRTVEACAWFLDPRGGALWKEDRWVPSSVHGASGLPEGGPAGRHPCHVRLKDTRRAGPRRGGGVGEADGPDARAEL